MDTELAALNRSVLIVEVVIAVVIVALLVGIVVASRRRKRATAPKPAVEPTNYYADLQQQPSGRHDPFGRFAAAPAQTGNGTTARNPTSASPVAPNPTASPTANPTSANPTASPTANPTSANPVFTTPASTSYPTEAVGASNGLDLTAPVAGPPPGGAYAPSEASQGASPAWPSDPWAAGSGVATTFHADAYRLDAQPAPAPVTVAPASAAPSPPPGTPAGWLPDPNGIPDTLRYWDGSAWTQHFAQRS